MEKYLGIYRDIVSSTPDGIAFLDENYRYVIVNDAYELFSGVSREKLIGLTVAEYLGDETFDTLSSRISTDASWARRSTIRSGLTIRLSAEGSWTSDITRISMRANASPG